MSNMTPERGCFYRQLSTDLVYRCEQIKDARALFHIADVETHPTAEKRLIICSEAYGDWGRVPEGDELNFNQTYSRDAIAEYGPEVGLQGILFRRQYYLDPYLHNIGKIEIRDRLNAIADNSMMYSATGQGYLTKVDTAFWHRKAEEVMEHLRLTGTDDFFIESTEKPGAKILRLRHDLREKDGYTQHAPWGRIPALPERTNNALFKFGEAKHLRPALESGRFLIRPASAYSDPSLSVAQRDADELRVVLRPSTTGKAIVLTDKEGNTIYDTSAPRDSLLALEIGGDQNYYVWCCSKTYEPRLFVDFKADACLIIHDHNEFARRLNTALYANNQSLPGMRGNDVHYYDPLSPDEALEKMIKEPLAIMFFKYFRYTYQAEYRFVWPVKDDTKLAPINIEVGPLHDICDLIELN